MRLFFPAFAVTAFALIGTYAWAGVSAMIVVAVLSVLEVSLSFDNAVVNATVLERLNPWWQKMFLTVGIVIAVFGMRFVFPIAIVAITAGLNPMTVIDIAINRPDEYEAHLLAAHPSIAAFGGAFLLMIALDFLLEHRDNPWLSVIERPFAKLGGVEGISVVLTLATIWASASYLAGDHATAVLYSGLMGVLVYLSVNGLAGFFETSADPEDEEAAGISGHAERASGAVGLAGKAAFFLFLYLEVLDASFSFDGVIGAFAVSNQVFVIATGLGVGAMYVRSLTVFLVRKGTLAEYEFLEHGAHYAIGALAVLLFASMRYEIPDVVTGIIGVAFIFAALLSSIRSKRVREAAAA